MLAFLRSNTTKSTFTLTTDFVKDLNLFLTFLTQCSGVTFYGNSKPTHVVHLDASNTGLGGSFADMIHGLDIPNKFMNYSLVYLEILNIIVALKIWGQCWKDQ